MVHACRTSIKGLDPVPLDPQSTGPPYVNVAALPRQQPNAAGSDGGFCQLRLSVISNPNQPLMCLAYGCTFVGGSGRVQCLKLQCDCPNPKGCPQQIQAILPTLNASPAAFDCSEAKQTCSIQIDGLPIDIANVPCQAGECVDTQAPPPPPLDQGFTSNTSRNWSFAIACIPIAAAVVLAALLLIATIPRMLGTMKAVRAVKDQGAVAKGRSWGTSEGARLGCVLACVHLRLCCIQNMHTCWALYAGRARCSCAVSNIGSYAAQDHSARQQQCLQRDHESWRTSDMFAL